MGVLLVEHVGLPEVMDKTDLTVAGAGEAVKGTGNQNRTLYLFELFLYVLHQFKSECSSADTPAYRYWDTIYRYLMLVMSLHYATRARNFELYEAILETMLPFFFSLDRTNYQVTNNSYIIQGGSES